MVGARLDRRMRSRVARRRMRRRDAEDAEQRWLGPVSIGGCDRGSLLGECATEKGRAQSRDGWGPSRSADAIAGRSSENATQRRRGRRAEMVGARLDRRIRSRVAPRRMRHREGEGTEQRWLGPVSIGGFDRGSLLGECDAETQGTQSRDGWGPSRSADSIAGRSSENATQRRRGRRAEMVGARLDRPMRSRVAPLMRHREGEGTEQRWLGPSRSADSIAGRSSENATQRRRGRRAEMVGTRLDLADAIAGRSGCAAEKGRAQSRDGWARLDRRIRSRVAPRRTRRRDAEDAEQRWSGPVSIATDHPIDRDRSKKGPL